MFKTLTLSVFFSCTLGACVTQMPVEPSIIAKDLNLPSDVDLISGRIDLLEQSLREVVGENCGENIKKINRKINKLGKTKETSKAAEVCPEQEQVNDIEGKLIVGAVERIRLSKEKITLDARIDTGAENSSIGAFNIKRFERDGKKWVRFSVIDSDSAPVYEYPIYDKVRIKQGESLTERRIEIRMDVVIGGKKFKRQIFNLADRSYLEYQLLIGRSFLIDIAVVDVSRKYITKTSR